MPRKKNEDIWECDTDDGRPGPGGRNAANARERARMRVLSKAFSRLKTTLPWVPPDTKLSKLDTLRLATSYIAHLRATLRYQGPVEDSQPHPITFTWPFSFQQLVDEANHPDDSNKKPYNKDRPEDLSEIKVPEHSEMYHFPYQQYDDSLIRIG